MPAARPSRTITVPRLGGATIRTTLAHADLAATDDWDGRCCAARRDGSRCTAWAIKGTIACKLHAGKSREDAKIMGADRLRVAEARSALGQLGVPIPDTGIEEAVQTALDAAHGQLAGTAMLLATLDDDTPARVAEAVVDWHDRAIARLAAIGKAAADMGIAERREQRKAAASAAQVMLLAHAVKAIVDRLDLTPAQRAAFPSIAREVFAALPAVPSVDHSDTTED